MAKMMLALPAIMMMMMMMMMMMNAVVAEDHTVGDDDGWTFPSSPDFYIAWAARRNFVVGDTLVFNYATNAHTVAMVPRAAYEDCDAGNAKVHTNGPTEIPLNQTGTFFFICTIPGHCKDAGLKLAINVAASSPSSPSSAPLSPPSDDTGSTSSPPMPLSSPSSPFGAPRSQPPDDTGTASSSPPFSLTSPTPSSGAPTSAPSDDAGAASSQHMPALTYPLLSVSFIAFVLALK